MEAILIDPYKKIINKININDLIDVSNLIKTKSIIIDELAEDLFICINEDISLSLFRFKRVNTEWICGRGVIVSMNEDNELMDIPYNIDLNNMNNDIMYMDIDDEDSVESALNIKTIEHYK